MSTSSQSYFNNAYPGEADLFPGNIFRLDTSPKLPIGHRVSRSDGNVYRYAKFEETGYGPCFCMGPDISTQFHADSDNGLLGTTTFNTTSGQIGSYVVEAESLTVTKDQYAGGYLVITGGAGIGYTYRIKGNTASGTKATSGYFQISLYEPLQVALTAASDMAIIGSLYNNIKKADPITGNDPVCSGISIVTTTSTAMWAFVQTWGVCGVYCGHATTGSGGGGVTRIGDQVSLLSSGYSVTGSSGFASFFPPMLANSSTNLLGSSFFNGVYPFGFCLDVGDDQGITTIYAKISP